LDAGFWLERWQRNEIGFHQPRPHPALARLWPSLGLGPGTRVFVPLAGKSLDLLWLAAQGHDVVGIELSAIAVRDFAAEHGQPARIDLRCGDLFDLAPAALGPIDAVFDRASLVALPPAMRQRYAAQLAALSPPGTRSLLVTMEYDQARMPGPPHSVPEDEVRALFGHTHDVEFVERNTALEDFPRFAQRGVDRLAEAVYRLTRR
jgi:thiopurine S-methyltransferase